MNATEKFGRVAVTKLTAPGITLGFKMKPAVRRQYVLQTIRGRVPRDPAPPKRP